MKKLNIWSTKNSGILAIIGVIVGLIGILPKQTDLPTWIEPLYNWIKEILSINISIGAVISILFIIYIYNLVQAHINRGQIIILAARYYTTSKSVDVTDNITKLVEESKNRNFKIDSSLLAYKGIIDFKEHEQIKVDIVYYVGSKLFKRTFNDKEKVKLI